jgi:transposase-like protein
MEIQFSGSYEKKQYFKGVFLAHKPPTRSAVLRIFGVVVFAAIYIGLAVSVMESEDLSTSQISGVLRHLITFAVFISFSFQPYIKAFTQARNLWNNPIIRTPNEGTISSQGIHFGTSAIKWDEFIKLKKTDDLIVLRTIYNGIIILPRTFFQSDQDWKTLQQWADRYIKEVH